MELIPTVSKIFGWTTTNITIDLQSPYIPPFNLFIIIDKIKIPIEHMHPQDLSSLKFALQANNIVDDVFDSDGNIVGFKESKSLILGPVLECPMTFLDVVQRLQRESHHPENHKKIPSMCRAYPSTEGIIPAFNIIESRNKKAPLVIPISDLMPAQKTLLEKELNELGIRYKSLHLPEYGSVLQVVNGDADKLETLQKELRGQSNIRIYGPYGNMDTLAALQAKLKDQFLASRRSGNVSPSINPDPPDSDDPLETARQRARLQLQVLSHGVDLDLELE